MHEPTEIRIRGARQHNLKVEDLAFPKNRLVVFTGVSGSGTFHMRWEGALNSMMRRFTETKSPTMRAYYLRYFSEAGCSACGGPRLRPEAVSVQVGGPSIAEVARCAASHTGTLLRSALARMSDPST